uniref:Large ribosomal subunit protein uL30-like ferredoxin-like fold domain-containing protein n=1 Tax=Strombidium rassoulzadegani TaxID=1082188 RepID=A0A7S3CJW3_9SPIT|mmetsp:Transcript_13289/g.22554  ORF Transcript_13289/g.22554 Transcript_13289/m.22554 type:complete len:272 (+) Transcript_13289:178-993(+)
MQQGRKKKEDEKEKTGKNILMPEVFVSNHMKQQRNFVHYKRNKSKLALYKKAHEKFARKADEKKFFAGVATADPSRRVEENSLLLAIRIKGKNEAMTPQAQKILSELGLRQINNAVFLRAEADTVEKLTIVNEYLTYGYPSKKIVNELVRKRGFLRKSNKKEPITNNVLIEELFAEFNESTENPMATCICIEDIIDHIQKCSRDDIKDVFHEIRKIMWPFQLSSLKETIAETNVKHEAHGRDVRKKNTVVKKGGYVGFQAEQINDYAKTLI